MKKLLLTGVLAGAVSLVSLAAMADHRGGERRDPERRWEELDTNKDGQLTQDELTSRAQNLIENADANGDGAVSKDEMRAYHEERRDEWREKRNPDTNDDGLIDRTEFLEMAQDHFDRMDENGDGVLSEDERPERGRGKHHGRRH